MKRILTSVSLTALLLGCGTTTFEPATVKQDYTGKITNLSVVLQTDTLQDAFMLGTAGTHESVVKKRELMARKFTSAVTGISAGIVSSFKEAGVEATMSVATGPYDRAEQASSPIGIAVCPGSFNTLTAIERATPPAASCGGPKPP